MISLLPIHKIKDCERILYEILRERSTDDESYVNISHRSLPGWREHVRFIDSNPYRYWFFIRVITSEEVEEIDDPQIVGTCYLTRQNEIGIFILRKYRGEGFGLQAVNELVTQCKPLKAIPGKRSGQFIAHINPKNEKSIRLFQKLGFSHISNTYQL